MAANNGTQRLIPLVLLLQRLRGAKAADNPTDDELSELVGHCESWGHLCGLIVVFGLLIDVALAGLNPPWGSPEERWWPVVATSMVAAGVYGEIAFGSFSGRFQKELLTRSRERLVVALNTALEAAEQLEPMSLSLDQQKAIVEKLRKFKGQKVGVVQVPPGDPRTAIIFGQIRKIIVGAGWEGGLMPGDETKTPVFPGGIFVREILMGDPTPGAGMALAMALTENGIPTRSGATVTDKPVPGVLDDATPRVTVFVSPKAHPTNTKAHIDEMMKMMDPKNRPFRHPMLELVPEEPPQPKE